MYCTFGSGDFFAGFRNSSVAVMGEASQNVSEDISNHQFTRVIAGNETIWRCQRVSTWILDRLGCNLIEVVSIAVL
jgi:hypothetical protein